MTKVTWVLGDEEHVEQFHKDAPPNLEYRVGANLETMLVEGKLAGGIQIPPGDHAHIKEFFPNAAATGIETFKRTGVYRLSHLVVIRDSVLAEHPWLARALFDAFKASKEAWSKTIAAPLEPHEERMLVGLTATRPSFEAMVQAAVDQQILPRALDLDEILPGGFD